MISALKVRGGKVGVTPGTTTLVLNGVTVQCPTPGATALQVQSYNPPSLLPFVPTDLPPPRRWWTLPQPPVAVVDQPTLPQLPPSMVNPEFVMPISPDKRQVQVQVAPVVQPVPQTTRNPVPTAVLPPSIYDRTPVPTSIVQPPTYDRTPVPTNVPLAPTYERTPVPTNVPIVPQVNRLPVVQPVYYMTDVEAPEKRVSTVQQLDTKTATTAPAFTTSRTPPQSIVPTPIKTAASRIATAFSPYASFEQMKGAVQRVLRGGRGSLGLVLKPYGDISSLMYSETSSVMEPFTYCGPFDPQYSTRGEAGYYYDTPLGGLGTSVPTDLQLSRVYGYTPVVHGWTPFKNVTWQNGTWTPPNGRGGDAYGGIGPALKGAASRWRQRWGLGDGETVAVEALEDPSMTPAGMALTALQKHQDRIFFLSAISTAAVAATALVNILKDRRERKGKTSKSVEHSVQSLPVSGARRRRRSR